MFPMRAPVRLVAGSVIALEFLTPLRFRRVEKWSDEVFGEALGWYPAIGLLLGGAMLLLDRGLSELLPPAPVAALLVAALALLSGGLHLDGVADTADGMAVQGDQADRLGVMSAGNTGPAGVMALVLVLLIEWSALVSLEDPLRSAALVLAPALGRWTVVPVALLFHPARPRGLGFSIHGSIWPVAAPLATIIGAGAAVALFGLPGLVLVAAAGVGAVLVAGAAARLLDGVNGDVFGASIEVAQVVVWLSIAAAGSRDWLDPTFLT